MALALLEREPSTRVTVVDNLLRGHRGAIDALVKVGGARLRFEQIDLLDTARLTAALVADPPDAVLHFAALTSVPESVEKPLDYFRTNLGGGLSLLEAMRAAGVSRLVFSSTAATYGEPAPESMPITESTPQRPINPYGLAKLQFEDVLRAQCAAPRQPKPLAAVALRYFNVAGADALCRVGEDHRPETHLVPIALEVALGKRPHLTIFGDDYPTRDGTCIRDYVHVSDLVDAHLAALGALEPGAFRAWNIGIGRGHSVREVVESVRRVTGHAIPTVMGTRRAGDPAALFADPSAIARDLGWTARFTTLDAMVESAWRWMQANPQGYR
ncbi:MAG: UDP-glucose 4-epimerase GalE [Phycisphaera sp.]|nr:UDP-glucose 4-epimerase GalE [Phycisphaera sp.]